MSDFFSPKAIRRRRIIDRVFWTWFSIAGVLYAIALAIGEDVSPGIYLWLVGFVFFIIAWRIKRNTEKQLLSFIDKEKKS